MSADLSAPWEFRRIDDRMSVKDGMGYVTDAEGRDILHVGERTLSEAQNVAIGNVSAAAPGLLAELRRITDVLETWADDHSDERTADVDGAIYCARAAIAKAEGRAS